MTWVGYGHMRLRLGSLQLHADPMQLDDLDNPSDDLVSSLE
ncbi:hypothetical protein [Ferrithrix thermotolerans]|nr:hypothetical protein [Ferrithrix thermotolerans]